jgi:hypothetical protein
VRRIGQMQSFPVPLQPPHPDPLPRGEREEERLAGDDDDIDR